MKLVVAGNHYQYTMWKSSHFEEDSIEISDKNKILGLRFCGNDVVYFGTFCCRKDRDEIEATLVACASCCHDSILRD